MTGGGGGGGQSKGGRGSAVSIWTSGTVSISAPRPRNPRITTNGEQHSKNISTNGEININNMTSKTMSTPFRNW